MMSLGVLFTAATCGSVDNAVRFANSLEKLAGDHLLVLTGPRSEELAEIRRRVHDPRVILLRSRLDNLYYCRGVGMVWALHEGHEARYLCSCDDDLEFTEISADLLDRLDEDWNVREFAILTFNNSGQWYDTFGGERLGDLRIGIQWMNGDSMFVPWHHALACGVPDSTLDYPLTYYTEFEYQARLQCLTGRPLMADCRQPLQYIHHFREPGVVTDLRASMAGTGEVAAYCFWRQKYGVQDIGLTNGEGMAKLKHIVCSSNGRSRPHLIFGGLVTDWSAIWRRVEPTLEVVS